MHLEIWNDFMARAERLAAGEGPSDAIDQTIAWQLEGTEPFCRHPHALEDLQLPELHSGSPWRAADRRPAEVGDRWVAFVTLNPSLDEAESFPRLGQLDPRTPGPLVDYFDQRFASKYRGIPFRRGRQKGKVRSWSEKGQARAVRTWSILDGVMNEALGGLDARAPLGDFAAIVDAVPYKFRQWSAVPPKIREELLALCIPALLRVLSERPPSLVVLLGTETHRVLDWLEPVSPLGELPIGCGVRDAGVRRASGGGPEFAVLAAYHPTSIAWNKAGTRAHLASRIHAHLFRSGEGQ